MTTQILNLKNQTIILPKEIEKATKEFGFASKEEFISQAIREKILELKKIKFFSISEKIREGLLKKGINPEKLLREFRS